MSRQEPDEEGRLRGLARANFVLWRKTASGEALTRLTKINGGDWAHGFAKIYASRGDVDDAFRWLDRSHAQKDVDLCHVKGDPVFAKVAHNSRHGAFLRKMNLPD